MGSTISGISTSTLIVTAAIATGTAAIATEATGLMSAEALTLALSLALGVEAVGVAGAAVNVNGMSLLLHLVELLIEGDFIALLKGVSGDAGGVDEDVLAGAVGDETVPLGGVEKLDCSLARHSGFCTNK